MRAHFENENVCADVIKFDQSLSDKLGNNWALGWRQMLSEGGGHWSGRGCRGWSEGADSLSGGRGSGGIMVTEASFQLNAGYQKLYV